MTLYTAAGFEKHAALFKRLGKHKTGKACLYIRQMADVDVAVLEEFLRKAVAEARALDRAR